MMTLHISDNDLGKKEKWNIVKDDSVTSSLYFSYFYHVANPTITYKFQSLLTNTNKFISHCHFMVKCLNSIHF